jgi:hypothetical protein
MAIPTDKLLCLQYSALVSTKIAFSCRAQPIVGGALGKRQSDRGAITEVSQLSVLCAEPLNVCQSAVHNGATLTKIISKRKRVECGTMREEE